MLKLFGLVLIPYALLCVFVYARQRSLIYYPTPASGSGVGEAVPFPVAGAVLQLWVVRRPGSSAAIYFGGNAESVADSAEAFARAVPDRTWVFVNYRGYGGSSRLVLVTPFDSLVSVGQEALPWLPVSWLARDRFESVNYAPRVSCPTLALIAGNDKVIAPRHARRLVAAFPPGGVSAIEVPGAGHNDIQLWPQYGTTIGGFLSPGT